MDLNPRRRIPDNLDTKLRSGKTVADAIAEQYGRVPPHERRTKRGIPADAEKARRR